MGVPLSLGLQSTVEVALGVEPAAVVAPLVCCPALWVDGPFDAGDLADPQVGLHPGDGLCLPGVDLPGAGAGIRHKGQHRGHELFGLGGLEHADQPLPQHLLGQGRDAWPGGDGAPVLAEWPGLLRCGKHAVEEGVLWVGSEDLV